MKIINKNLNINIASYGNRIGKKSKIDSKSNGKSGAITNEEKVAISSNANELKKASDAIKSVPEIREEKIMRIKEQIENGTYEIDKKKIAENIIADILETRSIK